LANRTTLTNENIADSDDYKSQLEKYVTWTREVNFIFNGKGEIVSEILPNPIGEIPLIDVSTVKDFEFFVEYCNSIADFNVQFLSGLSDLAQVVKMQGWSVGYLVATENTMPEVLFVGPNMVLKLKVDPNTNHEPKFGYASPNADIEGSMKYLESVLAAFLSSRGLDASTISTQLSSTKFSSGIERLLAMIEQFEASKEDFDLFRSVESQFFNLFKKEFLNVSNFINAQLNNQEVRNKLLQESNVDSFETDLEVILDIFMLTNFRSEEFDNALPLIS
jgi:hypothetical protein